MVNLVASPSSQPPEASSSPSKCLLCVDDHAEVLSIMGEFLRVSGYSVLTAPSGNRGLQLLRRNPVDAVILDYEMPKMDGAELALRIKTEWPELPVLMFTGYPADVSEEVRRSVDAFVVKGDPAEKLLETLRAMVPVNGKKKDSAAEHKTRARTNNSPRGRRRTA
jgi:CheY-like chemotaxis protein